MIIKPTINIIGQEITIKMRKNLIVKDVDEKTGKEITEQCYGVFLSDSNTIYIDASLKGTKREETFMHELIEAVLSILEIKLQHIIISRLSTTIYGLLKSNKFIKPFDFSNIPIEEDTGPV